jgi:hypothetical protein
VDVRHTGRPNRDRVCRDTRRPTVQHVITGGGRGSDPSLCRGGAAQPRQRRAAHRPWRPAVDRQQTPPRPSGRTSSAPARPHPGPARRGRRLPASLGRPTERPATWEQVRTCNAGLSGNPNTCAIEYMGYEFTAGNGDRLLYLEQWCLARPPTRSQRWKGSVRKAHGGDASHTRTPIDSPYANVVKSRRGFQPLVPNTLATRAP